MDNDYKENFLNRLLIDYDMTNTPSDFGQVNILDNPAEEVVAFKNNVIYPAFNKFLKETLGKEIDDWSSHRLHGWVAGATKDYSLNYHNHRGSQISAVFYILCEEKESGGQITFTDPRQNANRGYDSSFLPWFEHMSFTPESGDFVVFPSFLYHFVSTYQSNIRLAIPVDLFLQANK
jgi:hypothetical protein